MLKAQYYAALERYDTGEDLESMYAFLMRQTEKTWGKTLNRQGNDVCPLGK